MSHVNTNNLYTPWLGFCTLYHVATATRNRGLHVQVSTFEGLQALRPEPALCVL